MDRIWQRLESAAKLFLVFVMGGALSYAGAFPFKPYLHNAFQGTAAVTTQVLTAFNICGSDIWYDPKPVGRAGLATGVTVSKPGHDEQGLVLATIGQTAKLLNRKGDIVHEWQRPYGDLPVANGPVGSIIPENLLYWQRAVVLPDGDLIVMINSNCLSPDGLAIARLDKDSTVKWVRHGHYNHDFDLGPDGNIYVLWQQPVASVPTRYAASLDTPLLDEGIEIISPDGKSLKRTSILEAFAKSTYSSIIESAVTMGDAKPGDRMHNNNVDVVSPAQVARLPGAKAGDVLISLRDVGALATFDVAAEKITWAMRGPWLMQHDPDILPNGNVLLFDNHGDWAKDGGSRILEVDPATGAQVWQYPAKDRPASEGELWSAIRGEQMLLANGNILVNETQGSRMLEVTRTHEIVWEYRCPFTLAASPDMRCNIMSTRPYAVNELPFLKSLPTKSAEAIPRTNFSTLD